MPAPSYEEVPDTVELIENLTQPHQNIQFTLPPKVLQKPRIFRIRHLLSTIFIIFAVGFTSLFAFSIWIAIESREEPRSVAVTTEYLEYGYLGSPCTSSQWFDIDASFGNFTYTDAKIVDAAWNLTIGRGTQALLGWLCYKIFRISLLRITQQRRVAFGLYTAISLHPLQATTIPKLLGAIAADHGWRGRAAFAWFVVAIAYILSLPTLLDVMTGYTTVRQAMVPSSTGLELFEPQRCVPQYGSNSTSPANQCTSGTTEVFQDNVFTGWNVGGKNWPIDSLYDERKNEWIYTDDAVHCVPNFYYEWGFSMGWVWVVIISTMVWLWGMFGLWFDAQKNSLLWRSDRRPGEYRDMIDISNALQEALGPDTCGYGDKELSHAIAKLPSVGFEAVRQRKTGHIRLCPNPAGCEALTVPDIEYTARDTGVEE